MDKVIFTVPSGEDSRKNYLAKHVTHVNISKVNGYAFDGSFLKVGERAELPIGSYVMVYSEAGSMKNWYPVVSLYELTANGLQQRHEYRGATNETAWALGCRDDIARIVNTNHQKSVVDEILDRIDALPEPEQMTIYDRLGRAIADRKD